MISFLNDYAEGCHPQILEALGRNNIEPAAGYGEDRWTQEAKQLLRDATGLGHDEIYFLAGGTLTNAVAMAALLRPHEAVLTASSGHIVRHEAGAIEATGHRVITVPEFHGKVSVEGLLVALKHNAMAPHMAKPRLLYISQSTEFGTVYSDAELVALREFCRAHDLLLFVDGARLANAVVGSDVDLRRLSDLADVFWLGGTKAGALLGEALVFCNPQLATGFAYIQKQRGALLAKGRLVGIGFTELLQDGLIFDLAKHANQKARALVQGLEAAGCELAAPCETNQVFAQVPSKNVESLAQRFLFHRWSESEDGQRTTIRLVTSWATSQTNVDRFLEALEAL